jgi:error-prone DNA polymerase
MKLSMKQANFTQTNTGYAELCVTSNFTFLTGASHPEELIMRAAKLGLAAIAITDHNTLAGVVRAYSALKEMKRALDIETTPALPIRSQQLLDHSSRQSISTAPDLEYSRQIKLPRLIVGARLVLQDSEIEWIALPTNIDAYGRLSRLLTVGKRRAEKGHCHLKQADLLQWGKGLIFIALIPENTRKAHRNLQAIAKKFPGNVFLGAAPHYNGRDQARFKRLAAFAHKMAMPMVAVGDVLMHQGQRRQLADVLSCMREGIKIDQIGKHALANSERRIKPANDMTRLFKAYPAAIKRTLEIATRCTFCLSELKYDYPHENKTNETAHQRLTRLVGEGIKTRYPDKVPQKTTSLVKKELALIKQLGFASYFLTVHDLVKYARNLDILCQGRGSAANSVICYVLGITEVPPDMISMVFERFISENRGEPPDIDVDFEHERREEVIQHIYEKYGRHRAGICATVIHFRRKAAIGEVGKVMGLSQDITASLSGRRWGKSDGSVTDDEIRGIGLNPDDKRLRQTMGLIKEITGFPRHLSQHVGGFIITQNRLDELCPIENAAMENRTVIEWDKDDIDALGILKIDVLSLGMLTCIRKSFDLISQHGGVQHTIDGIPKADTKTYDMLCEADAIGVFQVESRAQLNFLPRMKPREFYDLVIEVAIVRPGPIQGGMVHPFIRRRQGLEKWSFPSRELKDLLEKTHGVPLFQEQAMQIAVVAAGFTPGEADQLRRSLATFKRMGTISTFRDKFINGMLAKNYELDFAERCFSQIEGFSEYGFPESHAASFALLAYVSAWLKCHHPAAFTCALLNSQPMGFYAPAQLIRDARDHLIEVRPICVNTSGWDNTLEHRSDGALAVRLGFRQIKGFREEDAKKIIEYCGNGYPDPISLWQRACISAKALERLADADAFTNMGLKRRDALWQVKAIRSDKQLPLFSDPIDGEMIYEPHVDLPYMHMGEEVVEDYVATRLSLKAHPMELLRPSFSGLVPHCELITAALKRTTVCGLVITRQRPGTASGVIFITLEDETGTSNVIVWPKISKKYQRAVVAGRLLKVTGYLQREGIVIHLIAQHIEDVSFMLSKLGHPNSEAIGIMDAKTDEAPHGFRQKGIAKSSAARHPREQAKRLFPSRDFH